MDMQMPEMDDRTATRVLRGNACDLPIIALTAHARDSNLQRCIDANCYEFTTKPIEKEHLLEVCRLAAGCELRAEPTRSVPVQDDS